MTITDEEILDKCKWLLQGNCESQALQVTLDEFQRYYAGMMQLTNSAPAVSLVNLNSVIKAQFSEFSSQHFDIVHNEVLNLQDFGFIPNFIWHGPHESPRGFGEFLKIELY